MPGTEQGPRLSTEGPDEATITRTDSSGTDRRGEPARPPRQQIDRPARTSQPAAPSDSPSAVAEAVARILDGGPTPEEQGTPAALRAISRTRSAARRILEARLEPEDENALLGALIHRTYDAELGDGCRDAILLEVRGPEDIETADHRWLVAQERLNRANFISCPICMTPVRDEKALQRLRDGDEAAQAARARWEEVASW